MVKKREISPKILLILMVLMIAVLIVGFNIWVDYRDQIMENHESQLLLTTQTLADNMELSLSEYLDNLEFLSTMEEMESHKEIFQIFLEKQSKYECNLLWEDLTGTIVDSIYPMTLDNPILISQISEDKSVWQYSDQEENNYLVFKKTLSSGKKLGLVINEEAYYKQLILGIHIGTNGYVVVKNSDGIIIMHPEKKQWGIHVIDGRKELYPELDFTSLDAMVEEQKSGKEGVSHYYSYWWVDPDLPRVKKISTYAPASIGEDFWVISAVVDYADFFDPIESGFRSLCLLFVAATMIVLFLFFYMGKLLFVQKKTKEEMESLKELNERLEEVHKGQEMIAHQQRLQVMGTMTGGIAHEFNNFLTPIMGHAELLMMELPEDSEAYDSAAEILEAAEKAGDVVRQISSLSRRNVETVYKVIEVRKLFSRAMKMIESICPINVQIEKDFHLQGECILGNATQINQVLLNICTNAFYAIGKKEGKLMVSAKCVGKEYLISRRERFLNHFSDEWEQYLCIDISDNGCGMDGEVLRQIFNPFFTTKAAGEGTGLGLAVAEQIITSHKGYIYAESEVRKGTTFHILLPILDTNTDIKKIALKKEEQLKILVADDNVKVLKLLEKSFSKLGITIETCRDKDSIQRILEQKQIDVLVIDETLEYGRGIEFCMSMQGKHPDLIKIIMVDYFTKDIVEAKHNGIIDGYLSKPVSDTTIIEAIRNCKK